MATTVHCENHFIINWNNIFWTGRVCCRFQFWAFCLDFWNIKDTQASLYHFFGILMYSTKHLVHWSTSWSSNVTWKFTNSYSKISWLPKESLFHAQGKVLPFWHHQLSLYDISDLFYPDSCFKMIIYLFIYLFTAFQRSNMQMVKQ